MVNGKEGGRGGGEGLVSQIKKKGGGLKGKHGGEGEGGFNREWGRRVGGQEMAGPRALQRHGMVACTAFLQDSAADELSV